MFFRLVFSVQVGRKQNFKNTLWYAPHLEPKCIQDVLCVLSEGLHLDRDVIVGDTDATSPGPARADVDVKLVQSVLNHGVNEKVHKVIHFPPKSSGVVPLEETGKRMIEVKKKIGGQLILIYNSHYKILTTFLLIPGWFLVRLSLDFALAGNRSRDPLRRSLLL